jgi:nitroreductase
MTTDTMPPLPSPSLKGRLKQKLQSHPELWHAYWRTKQELRRVWLLRYFFYDIGQTYAGMFWRPRNRALRTMGAELLFQYHKLEKGLVMPGKRRLFGIEPAQATMVLIRRWREAGHPPHDPLLVGAVETLRAYQRRLSEEGLDPRGQILPRVEAFLAESLERDQQLVTPQPLAAPRAEAGAAGDQFRSLAEARRSVRDFRPEPVPRALIEEAVRLAQLSPSACNRQPCRVFLVEQPTQKAGLLGLQNGNAGFGHLAPHVAVITADEQCFFDASERHQPYVDGGLFSMSLILALRAHDIGSCCLNWCVPPATDRAAHQLLGLPASQRIIMLMAIGYAPEGTSVPRSPRRGLDDVFTVL